MDLSERVQIAIKDFLHWDTIQIIHHHYRLNEKLFSQRASLEVLLVQNLNKRLGFETPTKDKMKWWKTK